MNALDYINQSNTWQDDPNAQWRQNAPGGVPVGPQGVPTVPPWWPYWSGAPGWYPGGQVQAQPVTYPDNQGMSTRPYTGPMSPGDYNTSAPLSPRHTANPTGNTAVVSPPGTTAPPLQQGIPPGYSGQPGTPPQWRTAPNALQQAPGQMNWMQQLQLQNPSFLDMLMRWIGLRQQQYGAPQQGRRPGDGPGLTTTPNDNGFILL